MTRTYSDDTHIYSVDLMFSYVNTFKPKAIEIPIEDILFNLNFKGWSNGKHVYSPIDVLKNPKKYPHEIKRIKDADLKYPIMVQISTNFIIDGVHRTIKAMSNGDKYIKAYIFPTKLMKKFIVGNVNERDKVDKMESYELIDLFVKRFMKK